MDIADEVQEVEAALRSEKRDYLEWRGTDLEGRASKQAKAFMKAAGHETLVVLAGRGGGGLAGNVLGSQTGAAVEAVAKSSAKVVSKAIARAGIAVDQKRLQGPAASAELGRQLKRSVESELHSDVATEGVAGAEGVGSLMTGLFGY